MCCMRGGMAGSAPSLHRPRRSYCCFYAEKARHTERGNEAARTSPASLSLLPRMHACISRRKGGKAISGYWSPSSARFHFFLCCLKKTRRIAAFIFLHFSYIPPFFRLPLVKTRERSRPSSLTSLHILDRRSGKTRKCRVLYLKKHSKTTSVCARRHQARCDATATLRGHGDLLFDILALWFR